MPVGDEEPAGGDEQVAGARADFVRFRVDDRLVSAANPDDSGERTLKAVSPLVGFVVGA